MTQFGQDVGRAVLVRVLGQTTEDVKESITAARRMIVEALSWRP